MSEVKPWEPVRGGWTEFDVWTFEGDFTECECLFDGLFDPLYVTLANGQRIIVKALSEERKAERARRKEANR